MARCPRIWYPEAFLHVIVRGDNREAIFYTDHDYVRFIGLLEDASSRYECCIIAYVLMTNHVHLMVQTGQSNSAARFMQSINTAYTMYINKVRQRVGHLFQGCYHSLVVEKDSYVLELTRYVHLNPVRAKMVDGPEVYPWSSFRVFMGSEDVSWVHPELILGIMDPRGTTQRQRDGYARFVHAGMTLERMPFSEEQLLSSHVLGSPSFVARVGAWQRENVADGVRPPDGTPPHIP